MARWFMWWDCLLQPPSIWTQHICCIAHVFVPIRKPLHMTIDTLFLYFICNYQLVELLGLINYHILPLMKRVIIIQDYLFPVVCYIIAKIYCNVYLSLMTIILRYCNSMAGPYFRCRCWWAKDTRGWRFSKENGITKLQPPQSRPTPGILHPRSGGTVPPHHETIQCGP